MAKGYYGTAKEPPRLLTISLARSLFPRTRCVSEIPMNRTRTGLPVALALVTVSSAALAADEPPATPPASTATATAPATVAQPTTSQSPPTSSSSTASSGKGNPGVRQMFCLNMSMQCFSVHQAAAASTTATSASAPAPRRLDLNAPDIRRIVPEANLKEPIQ